MSVEDPQRFLNLGFEDYRALAKDPSLSPHEKVGFPDSYREGKGDFILADIIGKLSNLEKEKQTVLDIGCGCGELALLMIEHCGRRNHRLVLVDSEEMLAELPDEKFVEKVPGRFPEETAALFEKYAAKADVLLSYGVFQIVFQEGDYVGFFDRSLELLAEGGQFLIGDIPNISKRKRFFSSPEGIRFHQEFMQTNSLPEVSFNVPDAGQIDDAVLLGLVMRARAAGFDGYWLGQPPELPMANRREDLLVLKP